MSYCVSWDRTIKKEGVAIAIKQFSGDQLHLGVLCKEASTGDVIHLSNHFSLRKSEHVTQYHFVNIAQLNDYDHTHMLAYILAVYEKNKATIPYGPCDGGKLDLTGDYKGDIGDGLTCSSFVISAFESQGFHFIDKSTWPARDDDKCWQKRTITEFKMNHCDNVDDVAHFEKQFSMIGALRYRPHEVAASVTFSNYQNGFTDIQPISLKIRNEVLGMSSPVEQGDGKLFS
ncbi:hypothetical protein [Aeromonas salmonicida]|uniref:hypothetical protein n=1 Tax=Aeromonas salmonicida TaxID=645 RepID=UPI0024A8350C|nr:hypothetical protein [Aeromonas salmonicida]MDM5137613.1 hypothetical protein [Aeromonas salmonicida]WHF40523.1 hypothetical protein QJ050_17485 [Aeromonas salmonicida]